MTIPASWLPVVLGPETAAALDNIQKVLEAAGFDLKDVVSVTVFLADIHDFPDMNKVYKSVVPEPKPARATIRAAAWSIMPELRSRPSP